MRTIIEIEDSTGHFKVIFYHKDEDQVPRAMKDYVYTKDSYVKVYGQIRSFKEELAIVGISIKEIKQHDEITNHFL